LILPGPYRLGAKTRSACYPVRVLADPDAERELVRGSGERFGARRRTLDEKTPLCQECAKTGKNSPTLGGHSGHERAADLRI
jgi:hypothetical protein